MCDRTILLVEDSKSQAGQITRLLHKAEFENVVHVTTGKEAIAYCENEANQVYLALVDIELPGINGIKVIDILLSIRPELKIVALSAVSKPVLPLEAIFHGAKYFIDKLDAEFGKKLVSQATQWVIDYQDKLAHCKMGLFEDGNRLPRNL